MEWKDIQEASNYEVSNNGDVRNKVTKKILKGSLSQSGYLQVSIKIDATNKFTNRYIHRFSSNSLRQILKKSRRMLCSSSCERRTQSLP